MHQANANAIVSGRTHRVVSGIVLRPDGERVASTDRNEATAKCNATHDDEHAVSTDTAGPSNPNP